MFATEPGCLNSTQLQVGARGEGVRANATVHFSRIITFRETKGLLGGSAFGQAVTAVPRLILELHISGVKCCRGQAFSSAIKSRFDTKYHSLTTRICI